MCWIFSTGKELSFSVIPTYLCFKFFLVFILLDDGEFLLNTVEIYDLLCMFDIVAHWLSVSF